MDSSTIRTTFVNNSLFIYIMYTVLFYNFSRLTLRSCTLPFNLFTCHLFAALIIQNWSIVIFHTMDIFSAYFVQSFVPIRHNIHVLRWPSLTLKIQHGYCCSEIPRILFWWLSRSNDRLIWMDRRDLMRSSTQRSSADDVVTSVISVPICSRHIPFPILLPV